MQPGNQSLQSRILQGGLSWAWSPQRHAPACKCQEGNTCGNSVRCGVQRASLTRTRERARGFEGRAEFALWKGSSPCPSGAHTSKPCCMLATLLNALQTSTRSFPSTSVRHVLITLVLQRRKLRHRGCELSQQWQRQDLNRGNLPQHHGFSCHPRLPHSHDRHMCITHLKNGV